MIVSLGGMALTLILGAAGGALFSAANVPLAWMLGAMTATLVAALLRLPVVRTRHLRPPFAAIVGVAIGSAASPAALQSWPSLLLLAGGMPFVIVCLSAMGYLYMTRIAGHDRVTAFFASAPGGVYEMVNQGAQAGGDERTIALTQVSRIFLVVLLVPLFTGFVTSASTEGARFDPAKVAPFLSLDLALLAACMLGWPLGRLIHLPNPAILGPLLVSVAVHVGGLVTAAPPPTIVALAQIVLGCSIGAGFVGAAPRSILVNLAHGVALFSCTTGVAIGLAWLISMVTGIDFVSVLLAYSPGGMAEMALLAMVLGADVSIVVTLHLCRMVLVHALVPLFFHKLLR